VFYVNQISPDDSKRIEQLGMDVTFFESERPPESFVQRIKQHADATKNQLEKWLRGSPGPTTASLPPTPIRLEDYRWPWTLEQFRRHVDRVKPQAIICQYVTMAHLLDALGPADRKRIHCILDTHDILHELGSQSNSAGYLHLLEISKNEEVDVWNRFDTVMAIQRQEAELIQSLTGKPKVIVVGHAMTHLSGEAATSGKAGDERHVTIGYVGSANYSNWHALNRFLIEVWPDLLELTNVEVQFVIAGKICEWFQLVQTDRNDGHLMHRVRLLGTVKDLVSFYRQIDLAINPVQFGTGLKIKNVESLAFGKPLVTTESGATGMSVRALSGCRVAANLQEMSMQLCSLCQSVQERQKLSEVAKKLATTEFSENSAFSELSELLENLHQTRQYSL
jgi:glycosyltransferase involved in cell wall biosynthesis